MWASDGYRDIPSGPMIKTLPSNTGGAGLIPGQELNSHMPCSKKKTQSIKQKHYCNKFNKYFKSHPHKKKSFKKVTLKLP